MTEFANNPYASPAAIPQSPATAIGARPSSRVGLLIGWTFVFLLNLPICIMFAQGFVTFSGEIGMIAGIATWYLATLTLVHRYPFFGLSWIVGGVVVGMSQFFPAAHIWSGAVAVQAGRSVEYGLGLSPRNGGDDMNALGAWLATMITGAALLALAAGSGVILRSLFRVIQGLPAFRDPQAPVVIENAESARG